MILFYIAVGMLLMLGITRPVTVFLHELGHAIPALLATRNPVSMYVGSYGDPHNSLQIRVGRLTIWLRYSLFWKSGLCVANLKDQPRWVMAVFLLGGPLTSSILAGLGAYIIFRYHVHGALKLYIVAFAIVAIFDLLTNLIPISTPIHLYSGEIVYNDGYQLRKLLYYRRFLTDYERAVELYNGQQYVVAAALLERFIAYRLRNEDIYRLAISCRVLLRHYTKALAIHTDYASEFNLTSDDYAIAGFLKARTGLNKESLVDYDCSLALNPANLNALNNKAYTLNVLGQYAEAIAVFDKVIAHDSEFAYSYNNRGLAKIKIGEIEAGLADIYHSLKLDPDNAYAYRNLGIYYLEQDQLEAAQQQLKHAHTLDPHTHLLPELLAYTAQMKRER